MPQAKSMIRVKGDTGQLEIITRQRAESMIESFNYGRSAEIYEGDEWHPKANPYFLMTSEDGREFVAQIAGMNEEPDIAIRYNLIALVKQ